MSRGVRWFLIGSAALVTLAGCGRGYLQLCRARAVAARGGGRLPQLGHRQGGRRRRPHLADRRSRHVRRGLPAEGLGARRSPGDRLCRRAGASARIDRGRKPSAAAAALADPQQQYPAPPPQTGAPMSIEAPGVAQPSIRSSRCSARRRPICRRRRIGSAAAVSQPRSGRAVPEADALRQRRAGEHVTASATSRNAISTGHCVRWPLSRVGHPAHRIPQPSSSTPCRPSAITTRVRRYAANVSTWATIPP